MLAGWTKVGDDNDYDRVKRHAERLCVAAQGQHFESIDLLVREMERAIHRCRVDLQTRNLFNERARARNIEENFEKLNLKMQALAEQDDAKAKLSEKLAEDFRRAQDGALLEKERNDQLASELDRTGKLLELALQAQDIQQKRAESIAIEIQKLEQALSQSRHSVSLLVGELDLIKRQAAEERRCFKKRLQAMEGKLKMNKNRLLELELAHKPFYTRMDRLKHRFLRKRKKDNN